MLFSSHFFRFRIKLNCYVIGSWGLLKLFLLVNVWFWRLTLNTSSLWKRGAISFNWLILSQQSFCFAVPAHIVRGWNFVHPESLLLLVVELDWRRPHRVVKTEVIAGIALGLCAQGELGEGADRLSHLLLHSVVRLWSVRWNFMDSFLDLLIADWTLLICHGTHYATVDNVIRPHTWLQFKPAIDGIVIGLLSDKVVLLTWLAQLSLLRLRALRHPHWHGKRLG